MYLHFYLDSKVGIDSTWSPRARELSSSFRLNAILTNL